MVGRPLDEAELVERARRGDVEAYETLVRAHQGIAFRTAYVIAGNAADAEEAAQDGFVKAYRALGALPPRLAAFGRGCCRSSPTRRATAAAPPGGARRLALRAAAEDRPGDAAPSPEAALLAGASSASGCSPRSTALREERARSSIACRYFLELSEEETAAALGVRARHGQVAHVACARAAA